MLSRRQLRALQSAQQASTANAELISDSSEDDDCSASMSMSEENSNDLSSTDTIPPSYVRTWWQLRVAQDAAAARRRKASRARHLRQVIIAEEKERARRMELVAEAANFSAREAIKARQLARSIEDQEQYTRVREWMAEDKQAEEARSRARRLAAAVLKQEAHRQLVARLQIRQIESGKAVDKDGILSHHALVQEGRVRARLLLHAGLRIEASRIEMELEEEIAEENIQAEVRALSDENLSVGAPMNLDEELLRLLKGPGYSLARRSLGIESSSLDSPRHSVPSAQSGTRFLHSSGFSDAPLLPLRLSRLHVAILSLRASLRATSNSAESLPSETASLPCSSSSWSISSVNSADAAVRDWVVDGNIAENVFRLKETLSSRVYIQSKKTNDTWLHAASEDLQGAFGVVQDLGSMISGFAHCENGVDHGPDGSESGRFGHMVGGIGDAFKGACDKMSDGVEAVAQGARLLTLPPLPSFPFPNFAGSSADSSPPKERVHNIEHESAHAVAYDRKHIEQLLQRSDEIVRSELQATTSEFGTSASSSDIACSHAAAVEPPHRKSLCSPVNVTAAIGLSSPMSLRCSPAPASTLHVKDHAPSSSAPSSLEQLAALPIDELQPHRPASLYLPGRNLPSTPTDLSSQSAVASFAPRAGALFSPDA